MADPASPLVFPTSTVRILPCLSHFLPPSFAICNETLHRQYSGLWAGSPPTSDSQCHLPLPAGVETESIMPSANSKTYNWNLILKRVGARCEYQLCGSRDRINHVLSELEVFGVLQQDEIPIPAHEESAKFSLSKGLLKVTPYNLLASEDMSQSCVSLVEFAKEAMESLNACVEPVISSSDSVKSLSAYYMFDEMPSRELQLCCNA